MTATVDLAEYVANIKYDDLPADVVEAAKTAIRDALGVALFSVHLPWTETVTEFARETSGLGGATLWGRAQQLAPPGAALVNGTAAHGIEMDDRSAALDLHNGAPTIPAALACAEHSGASGRDLIVAVVGGYEVAYRVARATQGGITRFYWVSIRSLFGATTAAALALGLDAPGLVNALGIAGSMASGLLEHTQDPKGTMVKRLQGGGWPSQAGVTAAMLAARGFTGPSSVLEGRHGVCRAFCTEKEPNIPALTAALGEDYEIRGWETKPYAAVGHLHSTIDALAELRAREGFDPAEVRRIEIRTSTKVLPNFDPQAPRSIMAAQRGLAFVAAAALFYDLRDAGVWTEEIVSDPRITALLPDIEASMDPEIEEIYQATNDHGGVRLTATTADGTRWDAHVRHAIGTLANPMSRDQLIGKFELLAQRNLPLDQVRGLSGYLDGLDGEKDLSGFRQHVAAGE
ncbi:MmgE/PrpD family protein [Acrocarpospora catenulata]|uniref:MmgE/PrpD family protein n=1 Tax=Acrocarpospora catenulata TaxID=2836182 RepID=UPI001BDAF8BF|nr:MmgE/PrpD family protein [Acrocarpospora catenulata]